MSPYDNFNKIETEKEIVGGYDWFHTGVRGNRKAHMVKEIQG